MPTTIPVISRDVSTRAPLADILAIMTNPDLIAAAFVSSLELVLLVAFTASVPASIDVTALLCTAG
jgi:hypothetical protein